VDFDFLLKTAKRESSLNPAAQARTSSAAGLFQFVEQTWLSMVKTHGAKHGYGQYSDLIERGSNGRLSVSGDARRKVLDLRLDATASSLMAGELASDHASYLRGRIGREPTGGELYAAHFLGPVGSAKLIAAHESTPGASAASLFPAAAGANRSIFYAGGAAKSVAEVYANLTRGGSEGGAPVARRLQPPSAPLTYARAWVREHAAPVQAAVHALEDAAAPVAAAVTTLRAQAEPIRVKALAAVRDAVEPAGRFGHASASAPDTLKSALDRAERMRRDDLLIQMVMGEDKTGAIGASPLSVELLTLLSAARDR
jgi:hypothetical protein